MALQINLVEQQAKKISGFLRGMQSLPEHSYLEELQPKVIVLHGGKGEEAWRILRTVNK